MDDFYHPQCQPTLCLPGAAGFGGILSVPVGWDVLVVPSDIGGVVTTCQADRLEGCPVYAGPPGTADVPSLCHRPGTATLALASSPPPEGCVFSSPDPPHHAMHNDLCESAVFPSAGSYPPVLSSPITKFAGCSLGHRKGIAIAAGAATCFAKPGTYH